MVQDEPKYSDVSDLKDGFQSWRCTYEYRGIKYDIARLQRNGVCWFVVEPPDESRDIVSLVDRIDIRYDFLYHVCDQHSLPETLFYEAVSYATKDIDWFWNDSLGNIEDRMNRDKNTYLDVRNAIDKIEKSAEGWCPELADLDGSDCNSW